MYSTIMFDLGGVLFTNGTKGIVQHISETYSLNPSFVKEVMDGDIGSQYRIGDISGSVFWEKALAAMNIDANAQELNTIWLEGYTLIEETRAIILELKQSYKIYYLSDNVEDRIEYLEQKYDFLKIFDDGIFSYKAGVRKPGEKIYKMALELAKCKAQDALFIDDKESALEPAKRLGMGTLQFTNAQQLREDLVKMGVLT